MRNFTIVAAQDMPSYGSFTVEAQDSDSALAIAKAALLADQSMLCDPEPEGAHSLRIIALQEDDADPLFSDVSLDPEAPLWPGREIREAFLRSTFVLAELLASLGDAGDYPDALNQISTNLRLVDHDPSGALLLARARDTSRVVDWVDDVMAWATAQTGKV
jgi:hypothetical protein